MKIKYKHIRRKVEIAPLPGRFDSHAQWRVDPLGGLTVCTVYDDDGNKIAMGLARCHPREHYVKKIGRLIAHGRAMKKLSSSDALIEEPKLTTEGCKGPFYGGPGCSC